MITIKPFKALRPEAQHAKSVASRPYDVLSSKEAKIEAQGNPNSFLHITKSEIDLPESTDPYDAAVYEKAKDNLNAFISRNVLFQENKSCYYIYRLIMNGRSQTGLVAVSSVDDYESGLIKKHEFTRPDKELDRITHIKTTGAQTGNVFLAYRDNETINGIIENWTASKNPQYDFIADDGIQHTIWIINDDQVVSNITRTFANEIKETYIADGHHRAASAAKVRETLGDSASADADYFLTTLFPKSQLEIWDYNRVVKDINGLSPEDFFGRLAENFEVEPSRKAVKPAQPHEFGMYYKDNWYRLTAKDGRWQNDALGVLDANVLQHHVLGNLLGIEDQRTDKRIDFVGGIRGVEELQKRVDEGEAELAFSIYPVTIDQLFAVADMGEVMPPKTTWFEPKLRDGLLTHLI